MASVRERTTKGGEQTWAVLYRHGGMQRSKTFSDFKSADDFKELIDRFGPDRTFKMLAETQDERGITVRELAEKWLEFKKGGITPRAYADYRRDYINWIDPFFGHRSAAYIDEVDVQEWVERDLRRKLGAKSVADKHAILHGIFKFGAARTRNLVPHNPCKETELPKRIGTPVKGLAPGEWHALKEAAYQVNEDAADLILFLGSTGWRIGEATALTVRDTEDSDRFWVNVTQVQRKGAGVVPGTAKSEAAFRRIDVSGECAQMLRRRIVGKGPNDLVFTNSASPVGLWEPSTFRKRYFSKAVKLAGLEDRKPTPHWLRHTHVALCHAAGMSLPEIQRRIGHEDIKTTINVYGRKLGQASPEVMDRLDLLISGSVPIQGEVIRSLER